jgi:hypothetical protein
MRTEVPADEGESVSGGLGSVIPVLFGFRIGEVFRLRSTCLAVPRPGLSARWRSWH